MPAVVVDAVVVTGGWDPSALERGLAASNARLQQFVKNTANTTVGFRLDVRRLATELDDLSLTKLPPLTLPIALDPAQVQAAISELQSTVGKGLTLRLNVEGAQTAATEIASVQSGLTPEAFNAFAQASTQAFERIAASVEALQLTLTTTVQPLADLFSGLMQGAQDAIAEFQAVGSSGQGAFTPIIDGAAQATAALRNLTAAQTAEVAALAAGAGVGAAAALAARATQGFEGLALAQARVRTGSLSMADGIAIASAQLRILKDAEAAAQTGSGKMAAGFALAAQQARELADASGAVAPNVDRIAKGGKGVEALGHGARQTALHFVTMTAASVGADSAVSRLAANLLGMSVGFGVISVGAIVLFAAAKAFDFLTEASRKAKEEVKKAGEALQALRDQQRDPIEVTLHLTTQVQGELDGVRTRLERLKAARDELAQLALVQTDPESLDQFQTQIDGLDKKIAKLGKTFEELGGQVGAGRFDVASASFARLTQVAQQADQDQLDILRVGFQRQQQALEAAQAQGITTRHAFSQKAIDIAQAQANAIKKTLENQLEDAQNRPTNNQGERDKQAADEAHFRRLIVLEQAKLALDVDRIHNAQTLADLASLEIKPVDLLKFDPTVQIRGALIPLDELRASVAAVEAAAKEGALSDEIERARKAGLALDPILADIAESLRDIGNANIGPNTFRDMQDSAAAVIDGIDRVGRALTDVGQLSRDASRDLQDFAEIGKAIATGDIAGIISGGIHILGDLLGPSEAELERNRILAQNNDLLRRNNAELANRQGGIGGLASLGITAAQLASINNVKFANTTGPKGVQSAAAQQATADLNNVLKGAGLTIQQFADQIKAATGIDILDSKGRLVAAAFDQAKESINAMIDAATHFSQSFADQLDFSDLQARIGGGIGDSVDAFKRDLAGAGKVDSSFVASFFDGIDIRGDSAAFQKRLQELLALFAPDSTFFKDHPELLGGLTPEDWRKILNDGATAMEALREQVRAFADELGQSQLRSRLAGEDQSTAAVFRREAEAFAKQSATVRAAFANVDLGDPEAVRRALLTLFDQVAGGLTPDGLTVEELNKLFEDGAGFLDGFNKGLEDATKRMNDFNLPAGFRRAALAFAAGDTGPDPGRVTVKAVDIPLTPVIAPLPPEMQALLDTIASESPPDLLTSLTDLRAEVGAGPQRLVDGLSRILDALNATQAAPGAPTSVNGSTNLLGGQGAQSVQITFGDIIIQVPAAVTDPQQIGVYAVRELRRIARSQSGDSLQFGIR